MLTYTLFMTLKASAMIDGSDRKSTARWVTLFAPEPRSEKKLAGGGRELRQ